MQNIYPYNFGGNYYPLRQVCFSNKLKTEAEKCIGNFLYQWLSVWLSVFRSILTLPNQFLTPPINKIWRVFVFIFSWFSLPVENALLQFRLLFLNQRKAETLGNRFFNLKVWVYKTCLVGIGRVSGPFQNPPAFFIWVRMKPLFHSFDITLQYFLLFIIYFFAQAHRHCQCCFNHCHGVQVQHRPIKMNSGVWKTVLCENFLKTGVCKYDFAFTKNFSFRFVGLFLSYLAKIWLNFFGKN